jgi:hypothetical protein
MTETYTITRNGAIGVPGGRYGDAIELPVVMGGGMVRRLARDVADQIIVAARTSGADPIAWVTSNAMMPPLRWFARAEHVWQAGNNGDGELWAWFAELVEQHVADANVALECPEWDNQLYAVDLARFEFTESADGKTLQDDWQPIAPA